MSTLKYLLQCPLWEHEKNMQKRHKIERCSKDEIRILCDAADSERECGVAQWVAVARETDHETADK